MHYILLFYLIEALHAERGSYIPRTKLYLPVSRGSGGKRRQGRGGSRGETNSAENRIPRPRGAENADRGNACPFYLPSFICATKRCDTAGNVSFNSLKGDRVKKKNRSSLSLSLARSLSWHSACARARAHRNVNTYLRRVEIAAFCKNVFHGVARSFMVAVQQLDGNKCMHIPAAGKGVERGGNGIRRECTAVLANETFPRRVPT